MQYKCKICHNKVHNKIYFVEERMINKGEKFRYVYCSRCGTLQLLDVPDNMGRYYEKYPVFEKIGKLDVKKFWVQLYTSKLYFLIPRKTLRILNTRGYHYFRKIRLTKQSKILDVGCGMGNWLRNLSDIEYTELYGVDMYAPESKSNKKIHFISGDIFKIKSYKSFDLIMMQDSFEHMDNPREVLNYASSLLKDNGTILIKIPVMDSIAWRKYKESWYQIDAPRHLYLYTEKALKILCRGAGLQIYDIEYDSEYWQFYISENYMKGRANYLNIVRKTIPADKLEKYKYWSKIANKKRIGDHATFYIKKFR